MRRFRFRLDAVLEVRRSAERSAAEQFARESRRLREVGVLLDQANQECQRAVALRDDSSLPDGRRLSVAEAQALVAATRARRDLLQGQWAAQEKRVQQAHVAWQRCRMRLKALENLRDRRRHEHERHQLVLETRQLDEFSILRASRAGMTLISGFDSL